MFCHLLQSDILSFIHVKVVLYLEEQEESEDNDDQNEAESHDQEADQSEPEPLPVLSSVELYALRQKKLAERKSKIASLAQEITENPEQNVSFNFYHGCFFLQQMLFSFCKEVTLCGYLVLFIEASQCRVKDDILSFSIRYKL